MSDTHGYVEELRAALEVEGLIQDDLWTGRDARLWFLGDFFDRGPDGIAVLDLVRRLVDGALDTLDGQRIVHGQSIAAELAGVPYTDVTEPLSYVDGLALAIDGGIYEGGPCLLARLA